MRRVPIVLALLWLGSGIASAQIVKHVQLFYPSVGTPDYTDRTSASYAFPNYAFPYLYTSGDWDPTPTVYFEAVIAMVAGGGTASAELYNATDAATVSSSEVSTTNATATRMRSSAITLTTAKEFRVRIKGSGGAVTVRLFAARLVFIQAGTIVKTETVYDIHGDETSSVTSYGDSSLTARYYHDTAFLDGTVVIYHEGFLSPSNAANTAYTRLYDGSSGVTDSELTHTGDTTDTRKRSIAITLTNATTYRAQGMTSAASARIRGRRVIVLQSATPTKTVSFYALKGGRINSADTPTTRTAQVQWDADEWGSTSRSVYHEVWFNAASGDTASYDLFDGTTDDDTRTTTTTTQTRGLSGALSLTDNDTFDSQATNSDASNSQFFAAFLRLDVTLSAAPGGTPTRMMLLGVGDVP